MDAELVAVVAAIALTVGFSYTNGFHDAANAIATSVSTRALSIRAALALAAVGNLVGSFFGAKVAKTVGAGIVQLPPGITALTVVCCGLLGAIGWNLLTWYFGLPSSSSHALVGGLVGATLPAAGVVLWGGIVEDVVLPMLISPLLGFALGYLLMLAVLWTFRRGHPKKLNRGFRVAQTCSAAAMAVGHGMQDAAKSMGIVVLALVAGGYQSDWDIPIWVYFLISAVLAAGTYSGGRRIIATLGRKVIDLRPPEGFAAEATASSVLYVAALGFGAPISTTHTITSAIMGAGATRRFSAVRWGTAGNIIGGWVLTFPAAGLVAALFSWPLVAATT
ncbi:inorganic phosphate transporter [Amycolatopsis magusensis]|uniref:PiT family inorganic phosphate transporter n=1 Tax=Amycolatopsis magusensis TaxID=882444 RepID=A0ABS4PYY6_9PSEU|nr:inorganic phosphate transporter [Amycolatopsis magusensis]MBP2184637.1 PiT family inorganic phosphate transporter [Amycolatopsis magusensis]MDI5981763.1 inorganic phosphate transporter [Amycolatopsis magusensis]